MAYVTLCYVKMLQNTGHKCFILKQGTNEISEEFKKVKATVIEYPDYIVNKEFFKTCLTNNDINITVFNEYKQWNEDSNELTKVCKELGVKTYGYLTMEKFNKQQMYDYDRIIAPTVSFQRLMRFNKVRKFSYVPFSIDLHEFPITNPKKETGKFTFFHPGGWGGVRDRKNTDVVIEAFEQLDDENTELIITSLKPLEFNRELHPNIKIINKELSRKELINLYYTADATVLPSKWETVGLPILESLAAGTPVITTAAPPMNEFIRDCTNGHTCIPILKTYEGITVHACEIDPSELKKKMELIMIKELHPLLRKNSRIVIEDIYDLEKNKHYLLDLIENDKN